MVYPCRVFDSVVRCDKTADNVHTLQVERPADCSIRGPVYFSAEGSAAFVLALKSLRENDLFFVFHVGVIKNEKRIVFPLRDAYF